MVILFLNLFRLPEGKERNYSTNKEDAALGCVVWQKVRDADEGKGEANNGSHKAQPD
ncbi:hypothetical protein EKH55_0929 [Sinorhizobium alkalisoli]|nr:hypothetical protein EKH55_0929 [Sinorhizobium alkalisoli]